MSLRIRSWYALLALLATSTLSTTALGQCNDWSRGFGRFGSTDGTWAMRVFDDGSGPELFVGGQFKEIDGVAANYIAKWNGVRWAPLGSGIGHTSGAVVYALEEFDDGTGPALYAAGLFSTAGGSSATMIAKWNGATWSALGSGAFGEVHSLAVFDDGTGAALYAGGRFASAGGTPVNYVAKWDGSVWSALGTGMAGPSSPSVDGLEVFDDGSGPALYAGGRFTTAGGVSASNIAKWDGSTWSALSTGLTGLSSQAGALEVFDDGTGEALYAGGRFTSAGAASVAGLARWDGSNWSGVGSGLTYQMQPAHSVGVSELFAFDDGSGPALFVGGGTFDSAGGIECERAARWDGSDWSAAGAGFDGDVHAFTAFDDGSGSKLYASGYFAHSGSALAPQLARFDGAGWSALPSYNRGIESAVVAMAVHDDGTGPALYAGGDFASAGGVVASRVARWDGANWNALGDGLTNFPGEPALTCNTLCSFDDGSGAALYAGGYFQLAGGSSANRVAKWDGSSWSALSAGFDDFVAALTIHDDGGGAALYAGGGFEFSGGTEVNGIAKWNGTSWSALGAGMPDGAVFALAVFDDGGGPALFAGGNFVEAGGVSASNIAKWNGSTWSPLGLGVDGGVNALAVFDDGSGSALYAGGLFSTAGGSSAARIAKWNGSSWTALGAGVDNAVHSLTTFDDGTGPALYVGGGFSVAGGGAANRIARWDGTNWSAIGTGLAAPVGATFASELVVFDSGAGNELWVGGVFRTAGGVASSNIARFGACRPGSEYCFGDGVDPFVATDCPCGNFGESGRGCANSNALLGGARLTATGTTSPNTVAFTCDGIPNNTFCTFLRSNASLPTGFVFGDGVKCLNGTGIRFSSQNAGQNGNPSNTVSSGAAAIPLGNTRYYQLHYRNPNAGFCPPEGFNISNGYRIAW